MITKWINVDEKEDEMEIGYPTDVRHVSHIGWDSSPSSAPSWVRKFHFLASRNHRHLCFSFQLQVYNVHRSWLSLNRLTKFCSYMNSRRATTC